MTRAIDHSTVLAEAAVAWRDLRRRRLQHEENPGPRFQRQLFGGDQGDASPHEKGAA